MASLRSMGFTDPGWEHGVSQDKKKKKVKCNYCGKIVSGGIFRLKQHLARISGEVTYCKKAPEEVYTKMKDNLDGYRASKKRQYEDQEQSFDFQSNEDYEEDVEPVGCKRKRNQSTSNKDVVSMGPLRSLGYVDPGWEHGVAVDEKKKKVKCNYCEKVVSGGINRFKQHLARIPGEVANCKMAPEEVYLKMKENMKWHRTGRRRMPETEELTGFYMHSDYEEGLANGSNKAKKLTVEKDISCSKTLSKGLGAPCSCASSLDLRMKQINSDSVSARTQNNHMSLSCKQSKVKSCDKTNQKELMSAICKFFCYAAIPFTAANSTYFQKMLDLVGQYGEGFKASSDGLVSDRFLQDEVANLKEYQAEIKVSWNATGCSIIADTWKDVQGRTIINFLVSCPRGTYFLSSFDATDIVEDVKRLYKLLDKIVEEVGEHNVVQVITENTACYKAAGKMLEEKRRALFWTPCAAYCIDQMLEDFAKIKWVGECIQKGQKITKFIYNRTWLLNLMRKEFTAGKELLKPAATGFATSFTTLQNLLEHRASLRKLFQSNKWLSSQLCKSDQGKEVESIVLNSTFWKKMKYVNKSVHPVVHVLKKVDSDGDLPISSIYNDMHRAKIAIKAIHSQHEQKYGPFLSVIDDHWISLFQHPLYVAAYYLNPAYRYRPDFVLFPEVMRGVNECITKLGLDNGRRVSAAMQISDFDFAKADFGTELALSTRMQLHPASWWQQHGINCPELQRIAIRILSQTCSSFGCEHNWSSFDQIHSTRHSYLAQKKLTDIAYVHYNLRLKDRQLKGAADNIRFHDAVSLEKMFGNWVVESGKHSTQEDEEILCNEMEQAEDDSDFEDFDTTETRGVHTDTGAVLPEIIEPLDVHPAGSNEDDADLRFLDELCD